MRLSQILELSITEAAGRQKPGELRKRIISAIEQGGIKGVMDEFGCDLEQAKRYVKLIDYEDWSNALGKYEGDGFVSNYDSMVGGWIPRPGRIELEEIRAPQILLKIMRFFEIPNEIIKKLIKLHVGRVAKKTMHQSSISEVIEELKNRERITCEVRTDEELESQLKEIGFKIYKTGRTSMIYYPENEDVVRTIRRFESSVSRGRECACHVLRGLSFGYRPKYVFNYINNYYRDVIDKICQERSIGKTINRDQE